MASTTSTNDDNNQALVGVDVVGLASDSDGRSCNLHTFCGHYVGLHDVLICKWSVQTFKDEPEVCVRVFLINRDGLPACHVGYLPKRLLKKNEGREYDKMVLQVTDDLRLSDNASERSRSHRNVGMVHCTNVSNHPDFEGKDPFNGEAFRMKRILKMKKADYATEGGFVEDKDLEPDKDAFVVTYSKEDDDVE